MPLKAPAAPPPHLFRPLSVRAARWLRQITFHSQLAVSEWGCAGGKLNCQRRGTGRLTPSRPEGAIIICSFGVHQAGASSAPPSPSSPSSPIWPPHSGRSGFTSNYESAGGPLSTTDIAAPALPSAGCHSNCRDCFLNRSKWPRWNLHCHNCTVWEMS